jgi:hypothetical protein
MLFMKKILDFPFKFFLTILYLLFDSVKRKVKHE